jgi:hypothetical protein
MAAPVYSAGAPGNVISSVSLAASKNAAALVDVSEDVEGQVTCEVVTGSSVPSVGTVFSAYKVFGNSSQTTISAATSTGATTITLSSETGLHQGQKIALQQASGSKLGELATINGAITGSGPYSVPVAALTNSYSTSDLAYLIAQNATAVVMPSSSTGTYAANSDYSQTLFLGPAQWIVSPSNGDGTVTVTANVTLDKITSFQ